MGQDEGGEKFGKAKFVNNQISTLDNDGHPTGERRRSRRDLQMTLLHCIIIKGYFDVILKGTVDFIVNTSYFNISLLFHKIVLKI